MITCGSVPLPAATHHQPQLPDALISVMWAPGSPRQHAVICWRCCVHCSARFNSPRRVRPRSGVAGCAAPPWAGHWVVLVVVGEIAYRAFTRDQSFRHPPWCGVRPDRDATAIHQPSRPAVDTMGLLSSLPAWNAKAGYSGGVPESTSARQVLGAAALAIVLAAGGTVSLSRNSILSSASRSTSTMSSARSGDRADRAVIQRFIRQDFWIDGHLQGDECVEQPLRIRLRLSRVGPWLRPKLNQRLLDCQISRTSKL
jgi:hypothetical protein